MAEWNPALSTPELALAMVCPASAEQGRERWRRGWTRTGVGLAPDRLRVADENQAQDFNRRLTYSETEQESRDLADIILADLKRSIAARYPDHVEGEGKPGSLQVELDQQEHFLFVNSEGFIERGHDFDELTSYVRGDSRKLFVLTAEGGMGKSLQPVSTPTSKPLPVNKKLTLSRLLKTLFITLVEFLLPLCPTV